MADEIVQTGEGFYNIRGTFKIGGVVNIGTQASLARLSSGRFVMLDSYELTGSIEREVMQLTRDGEDVEAIINLHPFHTVHVEATARQFPGAKLYGTQRHLERAPQLDWEPERTTDEAMHALYAEDLIFTVPRGVLFVAPNENLHFSSVLAIHKASRTLHVDDTLSWIPLPLVGGLRFHPTLGPMLERRAGATEEFRAWAEEVASLCDEVDYVCTAHGAVLPPNERIDDWGKRVRDALAATSRTLASHERKWGR